jgi:hypothetical protein
MQPEDLRNTLACWLIINRSKDAIDPRDKVFSVLGLLEGMNDEPNFGGYGLPALKIDYSDTVMDVFSSVVKAVVLTTGKLDILGAANQRGPYVTRTWTPDWTIARCRSFYEHPRYGIIPFSASGRTRCFAIFSADLSTLLVKGILWDIIECPIEFPMISISPDLSKCAFGPSLELLFNSSVYDSETNLYRALWRTLLLDPLDIRNGLFFEYKWIAAGHFKEPILFNTLEVPQHEVNLDTGSEDMYQLRRPFKLSPVQVGSMDR